jgi:hypothetical protein
VISSDLADWSTQLLAELVDEWRAETIPERDDLIGVQQSDNKRHVIVRGSFLDHFFGDDRTAAIIDKWVSHSPPLGEIFLELSSAADGLAAVLEAQEDNILLTYENEFIVPDGSDEKIKLLVQNTNSKLRRFRSEAMKYRDSDAFRQVVSEIYDFVEVMRVPWKWLVFEVLGVYFARVFVKDFSWRFTDAFDVEDTSRSQPAPEFYFEFRSDTQAGETVGQATQRLETKVREAGEELTRFVEPLPKGRFPRKTASLEKYARWFYFKRICGRSVTSIARSEFTENQTQNDDRRKDIREGIEKAEALLSICQ